MLKADTTYAMYMTVCVAEFLMFLFRFYENVFNMSGAANLTERYGDWFSWDGAPRSKIFARNHSSVTNITTMVKLMRYVDAYKILIHTCSSAT